MITKLNFENISPFHKSSNQNQKASNQSGSKTSRDYQNDSRNSLQKSARYVPQQHNPNLTQSTNATNFNNILNSSTRINTQPCHSHTPKKGYQHHMNTQQELLMRLITKPKENVVGPSPHQRSTTMINIKQKENIASTIKGEEPKKMKGEIDAFKKREVNYLVKITGLENELKKIGGQYTKIDKENECMKNQLVTLSKSQMKSVTSSKKFRGQMYDEGITECATQTNFPNQNEQQIVILEEYTRLLKKKIKEIEVQGNKSNLNLSSNIKCDQRLQQNYNNLKNQLFEIVKMYYKCQKQNCETKSETKILKEYLQSKHSSYSTRQSSQYSEQKQANLCPVSLQENDESQPSFIKALNLPNQIRQ